MELNELSRALKSLVFFRPMMSDPVLRELEKLLDLQTDDISVKTEQYSRFVSFLYDRGDNLTDYILTCAVCDDNRYVRMLSGGEEIPENMRNCMENELSVLSDMASLDCGRLTEYVGYNGYLPSYNISDIDFVAEYKKRIANVKKNGYGIYAKNTMFRYADGEIVPVTSADRIDISDLVGYENEKQLVIGNTRAFISGLPAADVLLCGDAGTGKSSTVKAVVNMLAPQGLRILELRKDQLHDMPLILERLHGNPLKFILFIDDLSFVTNDDDFNRLKAILQGSVSARSDNILVYATSNRRHLVKEKFSDREGDDIHRSDSMQELLSLSERFGLTVLFSKPDKTLYLEIVHRLCDKLNIPYTEKTDIEAEAFALRKGNRSARAAEQFVDSLLTNLNLKERDENDA